MSSRTRARGLVALAAGFATATVAGVAGPAPAPVVEVNGELLLGAFGGAQSQVASFKGIPFAAAPVGDLHWREPAAPAGR